MSATATTTKTDPAKLIDGEKDFNDYFQDSDSPFDHGEDPFQNIEDEKTQSQEEYEELKEKAQEEGEKVEVTQIWKQTSNNKTRMKPFIMGFVENLQALSEQNITKNEFRIMMYILDKMEFGNLISIQQLAIAKHFNMHKSSVCNNFKSLRKKEILIKDEDGNIYMNSNLFVKGLKHKLDKERRDNLCKAQKNDGKFNESWQ